MRLGSLGRVRIATWNVNSAKQRLPRLLPWLDERQPDVVCLQETKIADEAFSELMGEELSSRGYEVAAHGEATWNGVAILSRVGLEDVVTGLDDAPGFPHPEARAVAATARDSGCGKPGASSPRPASTSSRPTRERIATPFQVASP